jgi:hypothetical protein
MHAPDTPSASSPDRLGVPRRSHKVLIEMFRARNIYWSVVTGGPHPDGAILMPRREFAERDRALAEVSRLAMAFAEGVGHLNIAWKEHPDEDQAPPTSCQPSTFLASAPPSSPLNPWTSSSH